ncbi:efflux RND transporter periplasmic adaptor subunit [Lentisalinibacter salinarum]|uniref:efflux RND transporter periplasmic adaptor subunit n=1 Tax=Lentisalinibacter salinarum TaxID=2992239 RepID=UPI003870B1DB
MPKCPTPWMLLAALALLAGCEADEERGGGGRFGAGPVTVITEVVEPRDIVDEVDAIGTVLADESVEITSRVTSIVTRIVFREGQLVDEGDLLVELENKEIRAELAVAEASLSESRSQYERARQLADTRAISASSLEELLAAMQVAQAQVQAAQARLENTLVRAPFSGKIGLRRVSPGGLVNPGTVITTLDDLDPVKLEFSVPETFLGVLREDLTVSARSPALQGRRFRGRIDSVDTRLDPVSRSILVRAILENEEDLLKPGMFLTVALQMRRSDVLMAPEQAIVPERGQHYVYVVAAEDRAARRQVELGQRIPGAVEIVSGLAAGDRVITEGTQKVREGSEVVYGTVGMSRP